MIILAQPHPERVKAISDLILRSALLARLSKDGPRASWFETALKKRLLTMRVQDLILRV
jgi:hypothetical protein